MAVAVMHRAEPRVGGYFLAGQICNAATPPNYILPMEILKIILMMAGFNTLWGRWSLPAVCHRFRECAALLETIQPSFNPLCRTVPVDTYLVIDRVLFLEKILPSIVGNIKSAEKFFRINISTIDWLEFDDVKRYIKSTNTDRSCRIYVQLGMFLFHFIDRRSGVPKMARRDKSSCLIHGFGNETKDLFFHAFQNMLEFDFQFERFCEFFVKNLTQLCSLCWYDILKTLNSKYFNIFRTAVTKNFHADMVSRSGSEVVIRAVVRRHLNGVELPRDRIVVKRAFQFNKTSPFDVAKPTSEDRSAVVFAFDRLGLLRDFVQGFETYRDFKRKLNPHLSDFDHRLNCEAYVRLFQHLRPEILARVLLNDVKAECKDKPEKLLMILKKIAESGFIYKDIFPTIEFGINAGSSHKITSYFSGQCHSISSHFSRPRDDEEESAASSPPPRKVARAEEERVPCSPSYSPPSPVFSPHSPSYAHDVV